MKFINSGEPLTEEQIASAEREVGLQFPQALREYFLRANGGRPDHCVYEDPVNEDLGVVVQRCLPLRDDRSAALTIYKNLVLAKSVVPRQLFPFAIDPGGDILFVDSSTANGMVYLWHHDTAFDPLIPLGVGLDDFWSRLKPDE